MHCCRAQKQSPASPSLAVGSAGVCLSAGQGISCTRLRESWDTQPCSPLQVFQGNMDYGTMQTNMFNPPITAQFIRIYPVMCRRACTLRFELIGCEMNGKCWWVSLPQGQQGGGGDMGQGIAPCTGSDPLRQGICQRLFFLMLAT